MEAETVATVSSVGLPTSPKPPSSPVEEKVNVSPKAERQSPEPNCAICLGKSENKSFTDSCLHQFCFNCLLEWSRVKPECPLCKQSFKSIIHNVRSNEDYDQYHLRPPEAAIPIWNVNVNIGGDVRRFRYRTTVVDRYRSDERYIQNWTPPIVLNTSTLPSHSGFPYARRRLASCEFRRSIYETNQWATPLSDITGRYRDCSPEFYRLNPAQVHRLVPWLNRELAALLNSQGLVSRTMDLILQLLPHYPIQSLEFRSQLQHYLGPNTSHFLHELHEFARSPYDMIGFDTAANYVHFSNFPIEVSSSSSDSDSDSDVIVLSPDPSIASPTTSTRTSPQIFPEDLSIAGPSGAASIMLMLSQNLRNIQSDGDNSSTATIVDVTNETNEAEGPEDPDDCMIVGYVKPRHERTPEIITLDSDEEDVVEEGQVSPPTRTSHGYGYDNHVCDFDYIESTSLSSGSSFDSDSSDSTYVPNQRRKFTRKKTPSAPKRSKGSNSKLTLKKSRRRLVSSSSSSSSACEHKKRKTKQIISSDSSDNENSVKNGQKREIWRIMKNQRLTTCREPSEDHDYSSNNYNAPYSPTEIAAFTDRPKLKSIIITRSATEPRQDQALSPVPSTSSHRSTNHKRRHKSSGKKDERRRRKKTKRRSSSSSASPPHSSKSKRKRKKRSWKHSTSSDSSS